MSDEFDERSDVPAPGAPERDAPGPDAPIADDPDDDMRRKVDELKELCDLKARGALSLAEFEARKSRLLES